MREVPHFHFLTLFPDTIQTWFASSILGRAQNAGVFRTSYYQLREFSQNKHRSVDDVAYGGGGGMVLRVDVVSHALAEIRKHCNSRKPPVIYFSPVGEKLSPQVVQRHALRISSPETSDTILLCGHYEGIDERVLETEVTELISLGDFVLTGGELPAAAFVDAIARQLPGVLGEPLGPHTESFSLRDPQSGKPLLEYPHYTRPAEFEGRKVPAVLLSGDHAAIELWRLSEARRRTELLRPDLR